MNKIFNAGKFILNFCLNLIILAAIVIILVWAIWDVSPQTSFSKTASLITDGWAFITGKDAPKNSSARTKTDQPTESKK